MELPSTAPPRPELTDAHRFELLVESVNEYAIYMLDCDGVVTSWNAGAEKIKGYSASEIIGQHFSRFFTPEDQARRLPDEILRQARLTGRYQGEGQRLRKDGSRFWVSSVVQPVHSTDGHRIGFAKVTRDISDRREAQQVLYDSERRFRLLVESVVDYAIYMLDPAGIVTNWNAGAERLKGYRPDEVIGQHFSRFYTKEDRKAGMPARVLETAAREGRFEAEGWRLRKDGSRFFASVVVDAVRDEQGELIGFAKITRDITERRAAQDALRESERQFRLLVAGVTDYALYMLDPNGVITSWNAGAERIKGYRADEIIGQHFSRFYPETDRAAGMPARALQTALTEGRFEGEAWRVRKDGSLFWANVVLDPIRDEKGVLIGFAKITRDITERRDAQLALERARAQRDYLQKMETLGQLTGGVAHDFNNLLMIVSGHVQTVKRLLADNPRGLRAAQAIETAATRGESLTRQLLTFSRRQSLNPAVVDIAACLESIHGMMAGSVGEQIKILPSLPRDLWPIRVDASEFELALVNVILNARDAMPEGGRITITGENVTVGPEDLQQQLEGDFVALTIDDTGSGIPADILAKVFDPFFTTKPAAKGSGLGLSQVHGFVHQSGGTVTIDSALGRGTRITLYLPRASGAADAKAAGIAAERLGGGTVLLVEDNPDVAEVSREMLQELGYAVETVSNAVSALERLERQTPTLVVSDIVLAGGMDGVGLARAIRERRPDLPVLLVTGYSQSALAADSDYTVLRKPFQLADLTRSIAKVIGEIRQPSASNLVRLNDVRRRDAAPKASDER